MQSLFPPEAVAVLLVCGRQEVASDLCYVNAVSLGGILSHISEFFTVVFTWKLRIV